MNKQRNNFAQITRTHRPFAVIMKCRNVMRALRAWASIIARQTSLLVAAEALSDRQRSKFLLPRSEVTTRQGQEADTRHNNTRPRSESKRGSEPTDCGPGPRGFANDSWPDARLTVHDRGGCVAGRLPARRFARHQDRLREGPASKTNSGRESEANPRRTSFDSHALVSVADAARRAQCAPHVAPPEKPQPCSQPAHCNLPNCPVRAAIRQRDSGNPPARLTNARLQRQSPQETRRSK